MCRSGVLTLQTAEEPPAEQTLRQGEIPFGTGKLLVSRAPQRGALALHCGQGQTLTARCWKPSDRLDLPEGRGARSLKRLFAERGVTPEQRDRLPVFCVDGVAAAAWGVGVDRRFLPEKTGGNIYIIMREI